MDYTTSPDHVIHATGKRMHSDTATPATVVSDDDINGLVWEVMTVIKKAGITSSSFDPEDEATYRQLYDAIGKIAKQVVDDGISNIPTPNGVQEDDFGTTPGVILIPGNKAIQYGRTAASAISMPRAFDNSNYSVVAIATSLSGEELSIADVKVYSASSFTAGRSIDKYYRLWIAVGEMTHA